MRTYGQGYDDGYEDGRDKVEELECKLHRSEVERKLREAECKTLRGQRLIVSRERIQQMLDLLEQREISGHSVRFPVVHNSYTADPLKPTVNSVEWVRGDWDDWFIEVIGR